jgi:hypothetical protein
MTLRSTYALDVETVQLLEELARRWRTSKSEVLRRAIRTAAAQQQPDRVADRLAALERLRARLTPAQARRWERAVRAERRAWTGPRA